jgi:hypothetical protein
VNRFGNRLGLFVPLIPLLLFCALGASCVSAREGGSGGDLAARASVPSPEEVKAREAQEAQVRRREFVEGELRWILETGAPAHAATARSRR